MKRKYIRETLRILWKINDIKILIKIYTVAKTHLGILEEKGGTV